MRIQIVCPPLQKLEKHRNSELKEPNLYCPTWLHPQLLRGPNRYSLKLSKSIKNELKSQNCPLCHSFVYCITFKRWNQCNQSLKKHSFSHLSGLNIQKLVQCHPLRLKRVKSKWVILPLITSKIWRKISNRNLLMNFKSLVLHPFPTPPRVLKRFIKKANL